MFLLHCSIILYRTHHNKHAQYTDTNRDLTVNVIVTSITYYTLIEVEEHEARYNSCISNSGFCFVRWVLYVREFCQIIITESFGHAPWWERKTVLYGQKENLS